MNMQKVRRLAGGLVALAATGLIVAGLVLQRTDALVLGVAVLIVVVAGLVVGLRFRLATLSSAVEQLSGSMQHRMVAHLDEFRRASAENSGLVLRSFRDLEMAHREQLAKLQDAGQALTLLSDGIRELRAEVASLQGRSGTIEASMVDLRRDIEVAPRRTVEAAAEALPGQMVEALQASMAPGRETGERLMRQVIRDIGKLPDEVASKASAFLGNTSRLDELAHRALARIQHGTMQEAEALMQLYRLFDLHATMPLLGGIAKGWAMEPVTMLAIVDEVLARKPGLVVECGSGTSTAWIGHALRRVGAGRLVSLEHLERFAGPGNSVLDAHGLRDVAEIRLAPLEACQVGDEAFDWYGKESFADLRDISMLVVDGPPSSNGPLARYPALPLMRDRLLPGALVLLDDAGREDEQMVVERWRRENPGLANPRMISERTMAFDYLPGAPEDPSGKEAAAR
ncbi:hypothetical protein GCM10007164_17760 [Luteimonas padinae]|uniref:Class I SAM-dependent methyltransferase n=1 Tax=Luteimonas padinae TaxID=1714359 RepID=A0ABV6SX73_9GAMM|nr:class I SAM-dependent methyltransferase [Luteimonas padinae]GHD71476.1 hypothetical protein GCM10007164_17760 [Luteimonas padinae]